MRVFFVNTFFIHVLILRLLRNWQVPVLPGDRIGRTSELHFGFPDRPEVKGCLLFILLEICFQENVYFFFAPFNGFVTIRSLTPKTFLVWIICVFKCRFNRNHKKNHTTILRSTKVHIRVNYLIKYQSFFFLFELCIKT